MMEKNQVVVWIIKVFFHLCALLPLLWLIFLIENQQLSADPSKDIQHFTGTVCFRLLMLIALIPLTAKLLRFNALFQVRKLLGLWCFFWAALHLSSYLLFEIGLNNLPLFFTEIVFRFYLTIGSIAWLCLFVMAISSFNFIHNWLGIWWKRIHMLFYPTLLLAICHYILSLKTITPESLIYLSLISSAFVYKILNQLNRT